MSTVPDRESADERDVFTFGALTTTGILWLINRAVFHPRGLALGLEFAEGDAEPRGWTLHAASDGEAFAFGLPPGVEDALYRAAEDLIRETKRHGAMPPGSARPR